MRSRSCLNLALKGDFDGAESLLTHLLHERGIAPNELINQCYRALVKRRMDRALKLELIDPLGKPISGSPKGQTAISRWRRLSPGLFLPHTEKR